MWFGWELGSAHALIFSCAQIWSGVWPNSNARRLIVPKDWLVGPPSDPKSLKMSKNLRTCQKSGTIIPAKSIGLLYIKKSLNMSKNLRTCQKSGTITPAKFKGLLFPESFLPFQKASCFFQKASCFSRKLPAFPESFLPFQKEQSFIIAHNRLRIIKMDQSLIIKGAKGPKRPGDAWELLDMDGNY